VEAFERLKQLVASAEEDILKAEGGNKAAGTRARQIMQDIKNAAQEVRQKVLDMRNRNPVDPMTAAPGHRQTTRPGAREESAEARPPGGRLLFEVHGIDLSARLAPREQIERYNPHRGLMSLLDWLVWDSPDHTRAVALKHVRHDEFWVPGHFPGNPIMPGVLMVEAGAQLACYLFNVRIPGPKVVAFLRIEEASFRSMVRPGDDLYLLCQEVRFGPRRFVSDVQGLVNGDRIAFDCRIAGMSLPPE
jgi:3-hydroxyacyl-[acyl-carrier-protein] dehydratase